MVYFVHFRAICLPLFIVLFNLYSAYGDSLCYDDVCLGTDEFTPSIWFNDRPEIFACPEPYAQCDMGLLAMEFCTVSMGYKGRDASICANNMWRMYATREQMLLNQYYNASKSTNMIGFTRSNAWFESTVGLTLPGILSKHLLVPLGEKFVMAKPLHILEVGSYEGGSATWYIRYMLTHPNSTLTCIDPWSSELRDSLNASTVFDTFNSNVALTGVNPKKINILRNDAIIALSSLIVQGAKFDHIYIDGSHMIQEVLSDLSLSWHLLAPGGILTMDDVIWRTDDQSVYATQEYSFTPISGAKYPYCGQIGKRSEYALEDAIAALISNLPNADVIYCGYHLVIKKLAI